jgi:hypothetical protein
LTTNDPNGLVLFEVGDTLTPLATNLNAMTNSISAAFNTNLRIWPVANAAGRTAKVTEIGVGNISNAKPLFVWRADATAGRNLEYTVNGSTWLYYSDDRPLIHSSWRAATTQSIPANTYTPITSWVANGTQSGGGITPDSSGQFQIPSSGLWVIDAAAAFTSNPGGNSYFRLEVGGAELARVQILSFGGSTSITRYLNSGSIITVSVFSGGGASTIDAGNRNRIMITELQRV